MSIFASEQQMLYIQENRPPIGERNPMLALPIFTCSHPHTIVGTHELNFCVRNGNRWTLVVINTNCLPVKEENNQRTSLALFLLNVVNYITFGFFCQVFCSW